MDFKILECFFKRLYPKIFERLKTRTQKQLNEKYKKNIFINNALMHSQKQKSIKKKRSC